MDIQSSIFKRLKAQDSSSHLAYPSLISSQFLMAWGGPYILYIFKGWMFKSFGIKAEQVETSLLQAKALPSTHSSSVADSSSPSASPSCPLELSSEVPDAVAPPELTRPAGVGWVSCSGIKGKTIRHKRAQKFLWREKIVHFLYQGSQKQSLGMQDVILCWGTFLWWTFLWWSTRLPTARARTPITATMIGSKRLWPSTKLWSFSLQGLNHGLELLHVPIVAPPWISWIHVGIGPSPRPTLIPTETTTSKSKLWWNQWNSTDQTRLKPIYMGIYTLHF